MSALWGKGKYTVPWGVLCVVNGPRGPLGCWAHIPGAQTPVDTHMSPSIKDFCVQLLCTCSTRIRPRCACRPSANASPPLHPTHTPPQQASGAAPPTRTGELWCTQGDCNNTFTRSGLKMCVAGPGLDTRFPTPTPTPTPIAFPQALKVKLLFLLIMHYLADARMRTLLNCMWPPKIVSSIASELRGALPESCKVLPTGLCQAVSLKNSWTPKARNWLLVLLPQG